MSAVQTRSLPLPGIVPPVLEQAAALQAAIALVRDGKTIAQAADELDQPRGEVLQAVMTDYRGLVAARARSNGDARSLDYWLHHPSKKVATAAEKLRDVHGRGMVDF